MVNTVSVPNGFHKLFLNVVKSTGLLTKTCLFCFSGFCRFDSPTSVGSALNAASGKNFCFRGQDLKITELNDLVAETYVQVADMKKHHLDSIDEESVGSFEDVRQSSHAKELSPSGETHCTARTEESFDSDELQYLSVAVLHIGRE